MTFDNEKLFDQNGHLTDEGLRAMSAGTLDELGSLEAAEHLTFCDDCLDRYTAMLESEPLLEPAHDRTPAVQRTLRIRAFRVFTNRYVTVAAAVMLAFTLWNVGVFQPPKGERLPDTDRTAVGISQLFSGALDAASDAMGQMLGGMQASLQSGLLQLSDREISSDTGRKNNTSTADKAQKGGIFSKLSNFKGE